MAKLIFETAFNLDPGTGRIHSYWPQRYPLRLLIAKKHEIGTPFFAAGYQNDPSGLEGNCLNVDWLHYYLPEELRVIRLDHPKSGFIRIGIDIIQGGEGDNPDFLALCATLILNSKAYLLDFLLTRSTVKEQSNHIKTFCSKHNPDLVILEDLSAKGYAYTDLTEGPNPLRYPIVVRVPRSISKRDRFLAMGARFENGQILVPGVLNSSGIVVNHPTWESLILQWRSFPSGHDDLLDAVYWSIDDAFGSGNAVGVSISPQQREDEINEMKKKREMKEVKDGNKPDGERNAASGWDKPDDDDWRSRRIGIPRDRSSLSGLRQRNY